MLLSTWRVRAILLVSLALLVGAGVIMTEAQEADEATRPPKSVRGTLDNVNTRVNTVVIKSDDGQTLSWRFDRPVIEEIRTFEAGTPVIVIYRQLPQGIKRVTALAFPGMEKSPIYVNMTGERVVLRSTDRAPDACDSGGTGEVTETIVPRGGRAEIPGDEGCWCCAVAGESCPTTTQSGIGRAYLVQCFQ